MALPQSQQSTKRHQSVFDIERQQRTTEKSANVSWVNGTETSVGHEHSQSQQSLKVVDVPSKRWGHSVTYLKEANVALFVGGQVASDNDSMVLTNEVYAMDLSVDSNQTWVQLSSDNLVPHAFAARAVTHDEEGSDERVFIVGGATNDCSSNATQVSMWKAGESWQDGQWSTPAFSEGAVIPERKRGARAIQVPVEISLPKEESQQAILAGGVSFMVLGGYNDESTCSNTSSMSSDVGLWTMGAGAGEGRRARNSSAAQTFDTRPLVLSAELTNISVADYSAVLLPANGTQGDRLLLLGGMDKDGNLTSFEDLWVLDLVTGYWSRLPTTNANSSTHDIPHGRFGHTSTRTENGTIVVYGGYTSLANDTVPTSDVHVLNYTVSPAVWSRVNSSQAPKRAFHTAFMAGQVMVVGFGQGEYKSSSSNSNSTTKMESRSVASSSQAIQFLDTTNWSWADSMAGVLAARQEGSDSAPASTASSSSIPVASTTSAAVASTTKDAQSTTSTREHATIAISATTTAAATPTATSATYSDDVPTSTYNDGISTSPFTAWSTPSAIQPSATNTSDSGSSMTPQKRNTAVIVSVLGAAAVAASMAGLYAAHKRREAYKNGDHYSMSGDKYEHFSSSAPGPPVSALWFHELKRKATGGRSFKKGGQSPRSGAASAGTSPRSFQGGYTMPQNDNTFRVLSTIPATSRLSMRRNEMMQQEATREQLHEQESTMQSNRLSDQFLTSFFTDDDQYENGRTLIMPPPTAYNTRALSSESLESDGAMSHFSYPYLSAMHRHGPNGSPSTNCSSGQNSPQQDGKDGYSNFAMSPTWSPSPDAVEIATIEKRRSVDSIESASNPFEDPIYPGQFGQDVPVVPQQAFFDSNDQRRNQQSILRVMNDVGY
jgi:hypothetical protein